MTRQYSICILIKYVLLSSSLVISLFGCLIRPDVDPKQLPDRPNSFSAGSHLIEVNRVYVVQVWDFRNSDSKVVWRIESNSGVPAENFTITVGEVPEKFVQTIPEKNKQFRLIKGQKYRIVILTDNWPPDVDPRGTIWVAE